MYTSINVKSIPLIVDAMIVLPNSSGMIAMLSISHILMKERTSFSASSFAKRNIPAESTNAFDNA
jgi:hypothetical protein